MNTHRTNNPVKSVPKFRLRWKEIGATAVVMALVATGTYTALDIAARSPTNPVEATTPQCQDDSDTGCFWNATTQGDGFGQSFYADEAGNVYYLPVAATDTPEYLAAFECAKQMKGFSRDAMALSTELAGYWALQAAAGEEGAQSNTTYGEWVVTDNLQPMQNRYDYLTKTFCSD